MGVIVPADRTACMRRRKHFWPVSGGRPRGSARRRSRDPRTGAPGASPSSAERPAASTRDTVCSAVSPAPVDQWPSTRTRRPPGCRRATHRGQRGRRLGHRPQDVAGQHDVVGAGRERRRAGVALHEGRRRRRPGEWPPWPAPAAPSRGETSTPATAYPSSASSRLSVPVPEPRSATVAGGVEGRRAAASRQAARTPGSRSPWSAASSNVAASWSQTSIVSRAAMGTPNHRPPTPVSRAGR